MGRPEILTGEIKSYIAKLKDNNPKLKSKDVIKMVKDHLTNELMKAYPGYTRKELEGRVVDEQLSRECNSEISHGNKQNRTLIIQKALDTSTLNIEPINPEALPWFIATQVNRKMFLSKSLTVREAKWFNRLFGIRNDIAVKDSDVDNDPDLKLRSSFNVIATWAQFYALSRRK